MTSFAELDRVESRTLHLSWRVDFASRTLSGTATLTMVVHDASLTSVRLDSRNLAVTSASVDGEATSFSLGEPSEAIGTPLSIALPRAVAAGTEIRVAIAYSTAPDAAALQWLSPAQTTGKTHAYLFSQAQAIHARSMFPSQDTPANKVTYTADVSVAEPYVVVMSALRTGEPRPAVDGGVGRTFSFTQPRPCPAYLVAIAVGELVSRQIGPRSVVWSEPADVDKGAFEFAETEAFLAAGEKLFGPYAWSRYDLLLLPPSFPYGGMENVCLTFLTPTLIAGDRSLADVVAHEIAHSWFGNDVSCKGWQNFWLNEGWTVFAERSIVGEVHGAARRDFSAQLGRKALRNSVELFGEEHEFTKLVPKLDGIDPDDAFSSVPYEKGFSLLNFLASIVGRDAFIAFAKAYVAHFTGKSIDSEQFKAFFLAHFAAQRAAIDAAVDWQRWLHAPGMPPVLVQLDTSLSDAVDAQTQAWLAFDQAASGDAPRLAAGSFFAGQVMLLLDQLGERAPLKHATLAQLDAAFALAGSGNCEIKFRWLQLALASGYDAVLDAAIEFVVAFGRMKFTRPLYRTLNKHHPARAVATFKANWARYHGICAKMVAKDLNVNLAEL